MTSELREIMKIVFINQQILDGISITLALGTFELRKRGTYQLH